MTRLAGTLILAFGLAASSMVARAEQGAAQKKTIEVAGTVSAIATESITVKGKPETLTFTVDKETTVTAKGATHKTLELKAEGKNPKLTDFVKVGDQVTISYHDLGKTKHAASIRVTASIK